MIRLTFRSPAGTTPRSRFVPWQFSLRSLLLLMFLVGVGLVVYRWPWEVRDSSGVTTYRRGWDGKALKHGPADILFRGDKYLQKWYEDGDFRRERFWRFDEVVSETRALQGKKHGFCWELDNDGVRTLGIYRHGLKHGDFERISRDGTVREQWSDDKLHGPRVWLSPAGKELQTAEYENGRLVKWNGEPLKQELQRWLTTTAKDDPRLQRLLFGPVQSAADLAGRSVHSDEVIFLNDSKEDQLLVHWATYYPFGLHDRPRWKDPAWQDRYLGEALLEYALDHSCRWEYRFGLLTIVPIKESPPWEDRTGVYDVKFEEDSPQEAFWLGPGRPCAQREPFLCYQIGHIFYANDAQPIEFDLSQLATDEWGMRGGPGFFPPPRPRRDLLGQHLDRENCYCVQEGNKLVIKRYEKQK